MEDLSNVAQLVLGLVALKRTGDQRIFGKVLQSRGLYKKGNISFRVNKGGKTEKVKVEVDAPYDDPIWKLNEKSVDERRRILSENGSV